MPRCDPPPILEALTSHLESQKHSPATKAFLIQELQTVSGPDSASALGRFLLDDELCEPAARALLNILDGAVEQVRKALPKAKGRNRLSLVQAAGILADKRSTGPIKQALSDDDPNLRTTAAWALAQIADPTAIDAILHYAAPTEGWERIQATDACMRFAEKLQVTGRKNDAERILRQLRSPGLAPQA